MMSGSAHPQSLQEQRKFYFGHLVRALQGLCRYVMWLVGFSVAKGFDKGRHRLASTGPGSDPLKPSHQRPTAVLAVCG